MVDTPRKAIMTSSSIAKDQLSTRIEWIDIARGWAIMLVVLMHSHEASKFIVEPGETFTLINGSLRLIRMPLFFVCSGLLAYWGLQKPWPKIISNRIVVLLWVIIVWTAIYFAIQDSFPMRPDVVSDIRTFFFVPYGVLWFLYAILFATIIMKTLSHFNIFIQFSIISILVVLLYGFYKFGNYPSGYDQLLDNMSRYALFYFAVGFWAAPIIIGIYRTKALIYISFCISLFLLITVAAIVSTLSLQVPRIVISAPYVFFGLSFSALISLWQPARVVFGWLGKRTLEIFLFHAIFIGISLHLVRPLALQNGDAVLLFIFVFSMAGSVLAERVSRNLGMDFLFRPPFQISGVMTEWYRKLRFR